MFSLINTDPVVRSFVPDAFKELLSRGMIDRSRLYERQYLEGLLEAQFDTILEGLPIVLQIHDDFIDVARYASNEDKPMVWVVLLATWAEHMLNMYYRELLAYRGLSEKEITEIIKRNNFDAKFGWLMSLTGKALIPDDMRVEVLTLIEMRNTIVHYKAVPWKMFTETGSLDDIRQKLSEVDFNSTLSLLTKLDEILESSLDIVDPDRALAREISARLYPTQ